MAKVGRKQFGFHPDEKAVVEIIKLKARTRRGGKKLGPAGIARELNEEGYKTQTGKKWRAQTVKNILERGTLFVAKKKKKKPIQKTQLGIEDYLTAEQIALCRRILKDDREKIIFETLLGTGLRASEFVALQVRDLGIFDGRTEIEVKRGKGAKQRTVAIGGKLAAMLREYLEDHRKNASRRDYVFLNKHGQPMSYDNLYYLVKSIGKRTKIYWLHPHVFRHTFATCLSNYTRNAFLVKEQLGHSSMDTTAIYSKVIRAIALQEMKLFEKLIWCNHPPELLPENTSNLEELMQVQEFTGI